MMDVNLRQAAHLFEALIYQAFEEGDNHVL
jgi:hypothetical protein